jgi:hypothetical protein
VYRIRRIEKEGPKPKKGAVELNEERIKESLKHTFNFVSPA